MREVTDNQAERQFEMDADGALAFLTYRVQDGARYLMHTEVPKELRGQGVGSRLVRGALDRARAAGERVVPLCPFVAKFIERHPEYEPLVKESAG